MAQETGFGSKNLPGREEGDAGVAIQKSKRGLLTRRGFRERQLEVKELPAVKANRAHVVRANRFLNRLLVAKAKINRLRGGVYVVTPDWRRIALQADLGGDDNPRVTRNRLRVYPRPTRRSPSAADGGGDAAPTLGEAAFEPSARAMALLEGTRIRDEDLRAAGGAYRLHEVQVLLHGVSRQAVDKRVKEGSLFAVPGPSNRRSFPTLQFKDDGTIVDGLKDVLKALPTSNPWTVLNFLIRPDDRLDDRKPIDVLKAGEAALAVEAARRVAQQGA